MNDVEVMPWALGLERNRDLNQIDCFFLDFLCGGAVHTYHLRYISFRITILAPSKPHHAALRGILYVFW